MTRSKFSVIDRKLLKFLRTSGGPSPWTPGRLEDRVAEHCLGISSPRQGYSLSGTRTAPSDFVSSPLDLSGGKRGRPWQTTSAFFHSVLPVNETGRLRGTSPRNDQTFPDSSRGINGYQGTETYERKPPSKGEAQLEVVGNVSAEQKLYTRESARQKPETELPPPRRCRLSCPLPPPEYVSPERNEFLSACRAAAARFTAFAREFEAQNLQRQKREREAAQSGDATKSGHAAPVEAKTAETPSPPEAKAAETPSPPETKPAETPSPPEAKKAETPSPPRKKGSKHKSFPWVQQPKPPEEEVLPQMKALIFEPDSLLLKYSAVDAPTHINKDEVLVQVSHSGVCGMDHFITEGKVSCGEGPVILGHEISGKVYAAGSAVQHVRPGDYVAVNPYTACSVCRYCTRGHFSACLSEGIAHSMGVSKNGGWAEYIVVKRSQVHKIPPELGLDQAALIQPLSCIVSAMSKLNISPEMDVLIQGLGLAGSLWASVFHRRGLLNVFVSEKLDKKKEQFQQLNLGYSFIPPEDIGRFSADVIIECSGSAPFIEKAIHILNPNGQICFFGKPDPTTEIRCVPFEIVTKEIAIVGTTGNVFCFSKAIDLAVALGYRYLDYEKLGIRSFPLEEFEEAFQLKRRGDLSKIMFKFET